ncbi:uncharacterized protein LOC122618076 [Drosophila teissieri]|uniref:uncharacterized protein LOC122618076 n=1 Tax=Drosophila teissieri TaxID=7243 RepID=UPI001CB9DEB8|nr:uncharacterized protein LOC122618076 [Drosophila teissieri]XP_043650144.1 uncharacterized protein LOC122618076 [Drosophila teissieri]XP_043650145.1 uncharacterized protein LOC122618076 [Drosophila teissieri]
MEKTENTQNSRTAYEVQRDFGFSSGLRSEIIWDSLAPDQGDVLQQKIDNLICEDDDRNAKAIQRKREQLFRNIWKQRCYTNGTLLSAIIYVLVTPDTDPESALQSTNYSCHPVFRTRRCMKGENSAACCMIFVDENARVYSNWEQFVFRNTLPKGLMIAPSQGIYTFTGDEEPGVQLMVHPTPAARARYKLLNAGDKVATVGSLVSTVPAAAALAVPLGAPLVIAATAVGVATGIYSTLRSASHLIDRRRHGQSTCITDTEARSSWLGVAGGVVGLGATGATKALSTAAGAGYKVNPAAQLAVRGINGASVVIAGTGVANGVYDLYLKLGDNQAINSLDMLQMASHLVIFTHSINNMRIASKATNGSSLRRALRNQSRKVFDRISQETVKLHNESGQFDIVRTLNEIPFKEALLSLHNINSHLSQGLTVATTLLPQILSLSSGGQMLINMDVLAQKFGRKIVEHICNLASLTDVLEAMARYFSDQAVQLLMQMTRTFVEENVDSIDRSLNTFVSTEAVLFRILMHCVKTFDDFGEDFLQRRREDILMVVSKYFRSLEPVSENNCRKYTCNVCKGAYYIIEQRFVSHI